MFAELLGYREYWKCNCGTNCWVPQNSWSLLGVHDGILVMDDMYSRSLLYSMQDFQRNPIMHVYSDVNPIVFRGSIYIGLQGPTYPALVVFNHHARLQRPIKGGPFRKTLLPEEHWAPEVLIENLTHSSTFRTKGHDNPQNDLWRWTWHAKLHQMQLVY